MHVCECLIPLLQTSDSLKECDFQELAKTAWVSTVNKPFSSRTNNLAGKFKIWCRKKKTPTTAAQHLGRLDQADTNATTHQS
jgi:hypothetical protein